MSHLTGDLKTLLILFWFHKRPPRRTLTFGSVLILQKRLGQVLRVEQRCLEYSKVLPSLKGTGRRPESWDLVLGEAYHLPDSFSGTFKLKIFSVLKTLGPFI